MFSSLNTLLIFFNSFLSFSFVTHNLKFTMYSKNFIHKTQNFASDITFQIWSRIPFIFELNVSTHNLESTVVKGSTFGRWILLCIVSFFVFIILFVHFYVFYGNCFWSQSRINGLTIFF